MEKIRTDKTDLGWSMTTVLADARAGTNTWKGKQTDKPLFVANYYPNVWQLAVTAAIRRPEVRRTSRGRRSASRRAATRASPRAGSCSCASTA